MKRPFNVPVFSNHLQTLVDKAPWVDTHCYGWRLNLEIPQRIQATSDCAPAPSQGAYEAHQDIQFLNNVRGHIVFLTDRKPTAVLERCLRDTAAQTAALLACPDIEAAIELDRVVEEQARSHSDFKWYGVYRVVEEDLWLTSFRGAASPHIKIATTSGICGAAVRENATLNIADVHADPRYLSCSLDTQSELVVPIRDEAGNAIAEIDIDAHRLDAFDARLVKTVEAFAGRLAPLVLKLKLS